MSEQDFSSRDESDYNDNLLKSNEKDDPAPGFLDVPKTVEATAHDGGSEPVAGAVDDLVVVAESGQQGEPVAAGPDEPAEVVDPHFVVHGQISDEILNHPLELAFSKRGSRTPPGKWTNVKLTMRDFLNNVFGAHVEGSKDGDSFTQGACINGDRKAQAVPHLDLCVLDLDTGENIDNLRAKIMERGLFAIIATTHSHLRPISEVRKDTVIAWCKKGTPTAEDVAAYLISEKRYQPWVVEGAGIEKVEHTDKGVQIFLRHKPLPKFRIVFLLKDRFVIAERNGSQKAANQEWRERMAGASRMLGAYFDRSTTDSSRLFFSPRRPKDATEWRIEVLAGKPLDIEEVPRVTAEELREEALDPMARIASEMGASSGAEYKTRGLKGFAKEHSSTFEIADFFTEHQPDDDRGAMSSGPGRIFKCPFEEDRHTPLPAGMVDNGFFIINSLDSDRESFVAHCSHDSCASTDRLGFLDKFLCDNGLDIDACLKHCAREIAEPGESAAADQPAPLDAKTAYSAIDEFDPSAEGALAVLISGIGAGIAADKIDPDKHLTKMLAKIKSKFKKDERPELPALRKKVNAATKKARKTAASAKAAESGFPESYENIDGKLHYMKENMNTGEFELIPIAGAIEILGHAHDENSKGWSMLIGFNDKFGKPRKASLHEGNIRSDPGKVIAELTNDHGLWIDGARESTANFITFLTRLESPREIVAFSRPQWNDGVYASPLGDVIGPNAEDMMLADNAKVRDTKKRGTLDEWKKTAALACSVTENYYWAVGVMAGFAGCVVDLLEWPTCGINWTGPTSVGKSTAQELQGGVTGNPRPGKGVFHNAKSSANAMAHLVAPGSAASAALDELSNMDNPREVAQLIFGLCGSTDKARLTRDSNLQALKEWRTLFTTSSNSTIKQMIESGGGTYNEALATRVLDLSAADGVQIPEKMFKEIVGGCKANYGHALPVFAEHLRAKGYATDPDKLSAEIYAIAAEIAGPEALSKMNRAARVLAVCQRCGTLAQEAHLLPANLDVAGVISTAWEGYIEGAGKTLTQEDGGAEEALRKAFDERWGLDVIAIADVGGDDKLYRASKAFHDGVETIYIKDGELAKFAGLEMQDAAIARALWKKGMAFMQGKNIKHTFIPGMGGGKRSHFQLSYAAFAPKGEAKTEEQLEQEKETEERRARLLDLGSQISAAKGKLAAKLSPEEGVYKDPPVWERVKVLDEVARLYAVLATEQKAIIRALDGDLKFTRAQIPTQKR